MARQRVKEERRPPVRTVQTAATAGSGCPPLAVLQLVALVVLVAPSG